LEEKKDQLMELQQDFSKKEEMLGKYLAEIRNYEDQILAIENLKMELING